MGYPKRCIFICDQLGLHATLHNVRQACTILPTEYSQCKFKSTIRNQYLIEVFEEVSITTQILTGVKGPRTATSDLTLERKTTWLIKLT